MSNFQDSSASIFKYIRSLKISMYFHFFILLVKVMLSFIFLKAFNLLSDYYIKIIPCGVNFCFNCLLCWFSFIPLDFFLYFGILICSLIFFPFLLLASVVSSLFWQFCSCLFLSFWALSKTRFNNDILGLLSHSDLRELDRSSQSQQVTWFNTRFQGCESGLLPSWDCSFILTLASGNIWGNFFRLLSKRWVGIHILASGFTLWTYLYFPDLSKSLQACWPCRS